MADVPLSDSPAILKKVYHLYRDYFDRAEKKRRWSVRDGIPWDQCNPNLNPAIAEVVQTFCMVELYLPDYVGKLLPTIRANRGRSWMIANWGYEESKHSLALGDWLLKSGQRSEEQMTDMDTAVFAHEWDLPYDNDRAMLIYSMFQELATWLHYKNLRLVIDGEDPALDKVLQLISIDERAHFDFFRKLVELYLEADRPGTLEQMRRVANTFKMPGVYLFTDGRQRIEAVKELRIFDDDIFLYQVFEPVIAALGVHKSELRRRNSRREIMVVNSSA